MQLPATVLSDRARQLGYETSMFKRFQMAGFPVHMLRTQALSINYIIDLM